MNKKEITPQMIPIVEKVLPGLDGLGAEKTGAGGGWFPRLKGPPQFEQNPVPSGLFVPQLLQNMFVSFLSCNVRLKKCKPNLGAYRKVA